MDTLPQQWSFKEGDQVRGADDHKIGKVVAFWPDMIEPTHLVVEQGLLVRHDYYIPLGAIADYDGQTIRLHLTKEAVLARGWEAPPGGLPGLEGTERVF